MHCAYLHTVQLQTCIVALFYTQLSSITVCWHYDQLVYRICSRSFPQFNQLLSGSRHAYLSNFVFKNLSMFQLLC